MCGWRVGGECRSGGEHPCLGPFPHEKEMCDGDCKEVGVS